MWFVNWVIGALLEICSLYYSAYIPLLCENGEYIKVLTAETVKIDYTIHDC